MPEAETPMPTLKIRIHIPEFWNQIIISQILILNVPIIFIRFWKKNSVKNCKLWSLRHSFGALHSRACLDFWSWPASMIWGFTQILRLFWSISVAYSSLEDLAKSHIYKDQNNGLWSLLGLSEVLTTDGECCQILKSYWSKVKTGTWYIVLRRCCDELVDIAPLRFFSKSSIVWEFTT